MIRFGVPVPRADRERLAGHVDVIVSRHGAPLLRALQADSFLARLRGLHALPVLGPSDAFLIRPCRGVQTWLMPYPIDVVFLDADGRVLAVQREQRGTAAICWKALTAMETAAGTVDRLGLGIGQTLTLTEQGQA